MATIDLTLDNLLVPAIEGYTPPFGTKITKTTLNNGGLSTSEVNGNVMLPFTNMRPKVVTENSDTTDIEYDAKLVFSSGLQAAVTLGLGNATYEGCEVYLQNFSNVDNTVSTSIWTSTVPANTSVKLVWIGASWLISDGFNIGDIKPSALTTVSPGWFVCNGQAISRSIHGKLFTKFSTQTYDDDPTHTLLSRYGAGDGETTFNLPDYRECALVGVGSNGTFIIDNTNQSHEVHSLGEFKDDQFQGHWHNLRDNGTADGGGTNRGNIGTDGSNNTFVRQPISDGANGTPRYGTTTHGKQIGVTYLIKVL